MRNQKVEEGETEEEDETEVEAETAAEVAEVVVEMGQEFLRPIVKKIEFCRWVGVSMEGIGESRGLGEGTGELLLKMGPFERGGLGGKRVILLRLLLLLILVVDEDCEGGIGSGRRRRRRIGMEILGKMGVFLGEGGRGQRWGRVEIGRDAAAFCSDLYFRFFLMHYIRKKFHQNANPQFSQTQETKNEKGNPEFLSNFSTVSLSIHKCACVFLQIQQLFLSLSLLLYRFLENRKVSKYIYYVSKYGNEG